MQRAIETAAEPVGRLGRERAFWDDTYRPGSCNHRKYLWVKHMEATSYIAERFGVLLGRIRNGRVLSVGGGVDRVAVGMAQAGNWVVSLDLSPEAGAATRESARLAGVSDRLTPVTASGEILPFGPGSFDAVVCKRALHHMDLARAVAAVHGVLAPGGEFFAEEPICLLPQLRWVHKTLPFYPEVPITPDERELAQPDLDLIRHTFREVRCFYFDLLARESIAYLLWRAGLARLLRPLGKFDVLLLNRLCPPLRHVAGYAIVHAIK
jgi:SAM-dependent methyltransferase